MEGKEYRKGVGIMLINAEGMVFAGQRIDSDIAAWQMPQGGIDEGEKPLDSAFRELMEETMISKDKVQLIAETKEWYKYEMPSHVASRLWDGAYVGQVQKWFLMGFLGSDSDIMINTENPEFSTWKWIDIKLLESLIVDFKRSLYSSIIKEFYNQI